jgi:hypothetical protein
MKSRWKKCDKSAYIAMIQSLNENSLIQPFHIAMTRQDFEDFEKNAVSNFEEIEKNFK